MRNISFGQRPHFTRPTFDDSICVGGSRFTVKVHMVNESLLRDRIERFEPVGRFVLSLVEHAFADFDECFDDACRPQLLDKFSKELPIEFMGCHIWRFQTVYHDSGRYVFVAVLAALARTEVPMNPLQIFVGDAVDHY